MTYSKGLLTCLCVPHQNVAGRGSAQLMSATTELGTGEVPSQSWQVLFLSVCVYMYVYVCVCVYVHALRVVWNQYSSVECAGFWNETTWNESWHCPYFNLYKVPNVSELQMCHL